MGKKHILLGILVFFLVVPIVNSQLQTGISGEIGIDLIKEQVYSGNGTSGNTTYYDSRYLRIDQSTYQTIINGIPLLDTTPNGTANIKSLVNKEYVDLAVTSLGAAYYMYDEDDATGYKTCYLNPSSDAETYIEVTDLSDDDYIGGWISATGEEPAKLLKGVYNWYLTLEKTTGTKDLRVYWKLIERKSDNSEVVIATSSNSNIITSKAAYLVPLQLDEDYLPEAGSRIVGKLYADVSGSGNAPTIKVYYQGSTSSRWEIPANSEIFQNIFVPYEGAVKDIDLGNKNLTTTGTLETGSGLNLDYVDTPPKPSVQLIEADGNLGIGTYTYFVTYYTADGETDADVTYPRSQITTDATHKQVNVTIPVSSDDRVIGRRIYRTKVDGSYWLAYLLADINNNVDTNYIDNVADADLDTSKNGYWRPNTANKGVMFDGVSTIVLHKNIHSIAVDGADVDGLQGGENTFFGYQAGKYMESGSSNTFIGSYAGRYIKSGGSNVAVGLSALQAYSDDDASSNVAIGRNVLFYGGSSNVAVGANAAFRQLGKYNVWLGRYAGFGTSTTSSAEKNVVIGYKAGYAINNGNNNILIGYQAGDVISSGSGNIIIGYDLDPSSATASNELNIGNLIKGNLSSSSYLDLDDNIYLLSNYGSYIDMWSSIYISPAYGYDLFIYSDTYTDGSIIPSYSSSYDLGSSGTTWANIYADKSYITTSDPEIVVLSPITAQRASDLLAYVPKENKGATLYFDKDEESLMAVIGSNIYKVELTKVKKLPDPRVTPTERVKYKFDKYSGEVKTITEKADEGVFRIKKGYKFDGKTGKFYDKEGKEVLKEEAIEKVR